MNFNIFIAVSVLLLGVNTPVKAQSANEDKSRLTTKTSESFSINQVEQYLDLLGTNNKFMGSVSVYRGNTQVFQYASSLANNKIQKTEDLIEYRIGSITKTFTSVMIHQLIEEGKLSLEKKLVEFFPKVANSKKINIAQMLNHQSGIKNYTDDPYYSQNYTKPTSTKEIVTQIESYDSIFEPGSQGQYSNSNYLLLGRIIEQVTDTSYKENLTQRITKPLSLTNTHSNKSDKLGNKFNSFHKGENSWKSSPKSDNSFANGAGSIVSTSTDINRFIQGLFTGKLINENSLASMIEIEGHYGKGINSINVGEISGFGHGGYIDAYYSKVVYQPANNTSYVILSNGTEIYLDTVLYSIQQGNYEHPFKVPNFNKVNVPTKLLNDYIGEYKSETHEFDFTLLVENNQLLANTQSQWAIPLTPLSAKKFSFIDAGIEIEFNEDKKQFDFIRYGKSDLFTRDAKSAFELIQVEQNILEQYSGLYTNPDFPFDVSVFFKDGQLQAQGSGQEPFSLTAQSADTFKSFRWGITIKFERGKNQLTLSQYGNGTVLKKS